MNYDNSNNQRTMYADESYTCHYETTAPAPSAAPYSAADLPLADSLASEIIHINHDGYPGISGDSHYGSGPCDGDTVWFCSQCGDGPIGSWNPTCASCGHAYCGACTVEKV